MRYLTALLVLGSLTAPTPAADQPAKQPVKEVAPLTPETLAEMLTDLGFEPKDVSLKKNREVYSITTERDNRTIVIVVALSTDRTNLWFQLKTIPVPDPNADVGDAWFRLLARNATINPAYFTFNPKERRVYLNHAVENHGITPTQLRKEIEFFDGIGRTTASDWDPRKFRSVPVAPALSAAGRAFLTALDGTWEQVGQEIRGKKPTPEDLKASAITYTFAAGKLAIKYADALMLEGTVWVDPGAAPNQMDFYFATARAIEKGIVVVEGDTLTVCRAWHGGERPKEFAAPANFAGELSVFKRKKTP